MEKNFVAGEELVSANERLSDLELLRIVNSELDHLYQQQMDFKDEVISQLVARFKECAKSSEVSGKLILQYSDKLRQLQNELSTLHFDHEYLLTKSMSTSKLLAEKAEAERNLFASTRIVAAKEFLLQVAGQRLHVCEDELLLLKDFLPQPLPVSLTIAFKLSKTSSILHACCRAAYTALVSTDKCLSAINVDLLRCILEIKGHAKVLQAKAETGVIVEPESALEAIDSFSLQFKGMVEEVITENVEMELAVPQFRRYVCLTSRIQAELEKFAIAGEVSDNVRQALVIGWLDSLSIELCHIQLLSIEAQLSRYTQAQPFLETLRSHADKVLTLNRAATETMNKIIDQHLVCKKDFCARIESISRKHLSFTDLVSKVRLL
jgi:hypothetical protein